MPFDAKTIWLLFKKKKTSPHEQAKYSAIDLIFQISQINIHIWYTYVLNRKQTSETLFYFRLHNELTLRSLLWNPCGYILWLYSMGESFFLEKFEVVKCRKHLFGRDCTIWLGFSNRMSVLIWNAFNRDHWTWARLINDVAVNLGNRTINSRTTNE